MVIFVWTVSPRFASKTCQTTTRRTFNIEENRRPTACRVAASVKTIKAQNPPPQYFITRSAGFITTKSKLGTEMLNAGGSYLAWLLRIPYCKLTPWNLRPTCFSVKPVTGQQKENNGQKKGKALLPFIFKVKSALEQQNGNSV